LSRRVAAVGVLPRNDMKLLLLCLALVLPSTAFADITYNGTAYRIDGVGPFFCMDREARPEGVYVVAGELIAGVRLYEQWEYTPGSFTAPVVVTTEDETGAVVGKRVKAFADVPPLVQQFLMYLAKDPKTQTSCHQ